MANNLEKNIAKTPKNWGKKGEKQMENGKNILKLEKIGGKNCKKHPKIGQKNHFENWKKIRGIYCKKIKKLKRKKKKRKGKEKS